MTQTQNPLPESPVAANLRQGLGSLCWWELNDSRVTPDHVRQVLAAEHVQVDVPDIDPVQACKRAVRSYSKGSGNSPRYRAEVVRVDETTGSRRVVVGILRRRHVASEEVAWEQVDDFAWAETSGGWTFMVNGHGRSQEALEVQALVRQHAEYLDHEWIRPTLITEPLRAMGSLNLRRSGGIQYVAAVHDEALARVARVVRALGSCEFSIVRLSDDAEGRNALQNTARKGLAEAVEEVCARLATWESGAVKATSRGLDSVLAEFADARDRAALYRDALGIQVGDLTQAIEAAEARARDLLLGAAGAPTQERLPVVREQKERKWVPGTMHASAKAVLRMVEGMPMTNGCVVATKDDFVRAGFREIAWTSAERWDKGGFYRSRVREAGWMVVSVEPVADGTLQVVLRPRADTDPEGPSGDVAPAPVVVEPVFVPECSAYRDIVEEAQAEAQAEAQGQVVADDPDAVLGHDEPVFVADDEPQAPVGANLASLSAVQLREVYAQVVGAEVPPFRKGYGRKEMEQEIRAALGA